MNDRELMGIRADTLFTHDSRGRMVRTNEPDGRPAPYLFLGRTGVGDVIRFGQLVPDEVAQLVTEIVECQLPVGILRLPPDGLAAVRDALAQHAPVTKEGGGPAYRFPESIAPPSDVVQVTHANIAVVCDTFAWLHDELDDWGPCFAVLRDGAAVSVCFTSRIGDAACEAGLETLPDFRGRGYASAVTAAWGDAIRAAGRIPLYSTGWDNLASQAVARRVGLILFGANVSWA